MPPISVPFAPGIYKIVAGVPLLIFAVLALYRGWKNLCLTIRMLQCRAPMPRGSSPPFVIVGAVFSLGVLAVGFGASLFFLAMETTQPKIIYEGGIEVGVGPTYYGQKNIAWGESRNIN